MKKKGRKAATVAEKAHMDSVASLGCIICKIFFNTFSPANIHHVRKHSRRDHIKVVPLCPRHHQSGGYGVAVHAGRQEWEKNFCTEEELLSKVQDLV